MAAAVNTQPTAAQLNAAAYQQNAAIRSAILTGATPYELPADSRTLSTNDLASTFDNGLNVKPMEAGLVTGMTFELTATIANTGNTPITLTEWGVWNILSKVERIDLNGVTRLSCNLRTLGILESRDRGRPAGSAHVLDNYGAQFGNNIKVVDAPASIAAGGTGVVTIVFVVPFVKNPRFPTNFVGAEYFNTTQAGARIVLYPNKGAVSASNVANGAASRNAVYQGGAGAITQLSYRATQHFFDDLPLMDNGAPALPRIDMLSFYLIKGFIRLPIPQVNSDYTVPLPNNRAIQSVIYDVQNGDIARVHGSDIREIELQLANMKSLWRRTPLYDAQKVRNMLGVDLPPHTYFFDTSGNPITTAAYGNLQHLFRFSDVDPTVIIDQTIETTALASVQAGVSSIASL